jgi:hypothetical protein
MEMLLEHSGLMVCSMGFQKNMLEQSDSVTSFKRKNFEGQDMDTKASFE